MSVEAGLIKAMGHRDRAAGLAESIARAIGPRRPAPRYVDVRVRPGPPTPFPQRCSCCLLHEAAHQSTRSCCPRRAPQNRLRPLRAAAASEGSG